MKSIDNHLHAVQCDKCYIIMCDIAVVNLRWLCAITAVKSSNHTTIDSIGIAKHMSTVH